MSRLNRFQKGVSQLTVGGLLLDGGLRLVQMGLADGGQFLAAFPQGHRLRQRRPTRLQCGDGLGQFVAGLLLGQLLGFGHRDSFG